MQMSWHVQGPMPKKKSTRDFFLENLNLQTCRNLHEIDNKSNMKPKRHPMIHVGFALFTILVSNK